MKQNLTFIKIMFGCSVTSVILFSFFYVWGLFACADFYALLDCTLPFFFSAVFSVIGFGIAQYNYALKSETAKQHERKERTKSFERRYIIKTYGRNGSFQTRHITVRGDYGQLKSA